MAITIQQTEDLQAIHELDRACFPGDKPSLDDKKWPTHVWWTAEDDGVPVGYIGLNLHPEVASVTRVGVLASARRCGLQKRLIRTAQRYARRHAYNKLETYVLTENLASLRGFVSCGWKPLKLEIQGARQFLWLYSVLT